MHTSRAPKSPMEIFRVLRDFLKSEGVSVPKSAWSITVSAQKPRPSRDGEIPAKAFTNIYADDWNEVPLSGRLLIDLPQTKCSHCGRS